MLVLIAGGGISGLAAAIVLLKNSSKDDDVNVVLLEQDASRQARIQGYGLGISPIGAQALRDMGLADDIVKHLSLLGTHYCIGKANGTKFLQGKQQQQDDAAVDKMESFLQGKTVVNRGILRELMLNEIVKFDNAKIQWNAQVVDLKVVKQQQRSEHAATSTTTTTTTTSIVEVTLQNGQSFKGDVLLGCDGIFSNIRELLPYCISGGEFPKNPPLRHLGVAWVRGVCPERGQMKHWMMKTKSYIAGMSDTQGNVFLAESYGGEGGGDLCWFFAFPVTTTSATTSTKERIDDRDEILQMLYSRLQEGADDSWHSCVQQILQDTVQCNGPVLFRHLYDRTPEDVREWKVPQPWIPITLLGDAFHPVASYAMAGGGGNALADGMAVARELLSITNTNNLAEALRRYEGPVRERSITQAQKSQSNTTWIHSGWFGGYVAQFLFFLLTPVLWLLGKSP